MSTEKMREEFEAWWLGGVYPFRTMDRLEDAGVSEEAAQEIWQASRAALVIELPQVVGYEAGYDSYRPNEYADQPGEFFDADEIFELHRSCEVRRAIEAQGVKVTP